MSGLFHIWFFISSCFVANYDVTAAAIATPPCTVEVDGLAPFSDAAPASIPVETQVNARKLMAFRFSNDVPPASIPDKIPVNFPVDSRKVMAFQFSPDAPSASIPDEIPVSFLVNSRKEMAFWFGPNAPPRASIPDEIPVNFPEVRELTISSRLLIEAEESQSPDSPGYK